MEKVEFYQPILDEYAKLLKQHPKPKSVTFCWMQGERDANGGAHAPYKDALKKLIANLRRDLKRPRHEHRHWPHWGLCPG